VSKKNPPAVAAKASHWRAVVRELR
jgi:hypothetical protein